MQNVHVGLFLELGRRLCAHIGAVHMFPRSVLHQWLKNGSTERLRLHTSWMEALVFPLITNQSAKSDAYALAATPDTVHDGTIQLLLSMARHLTPFKHDPPPRQSHETSCLFTVFDHRPFCNICYFVLFFSCFFVLKLKLFLGF